MPPAAVANHGTQFYRLNPKGQSVSSTSGTDSGGGQVQQVRVALPTAALPLLNTEPVCVHGCDCKIAPDSLRPSRICAASFVSLLPLIETCVSIA